MKYPLTPAGEPVNPELYHHSLRLAMLRSRYAYLTREAVTSVVVSPLEASFFRNWLHGGRLAYYVEKSGLPRRSMERHLGNALDVEVDPKKLTRHVSMVHSFDSKMQGKRARNQFIWKGDWDLHTFDFKSINRYRFIEDIWVNRDELSLSQAYQDLVDKIRSGRPFRSHQKGVFLDSPEKIITYLSQYIIYMRDMQENGFDATLGKDCLSVAVGRDGGLLKLNRGLHRLAMAQVVGLDRVVVRILGVHVKWWEEKVKGKRSYGSLDTMLEEFSRIS